MQTSFAFYRRIGLRWGCIILIQMHISTHCMQVVGVASSPSAFYTLDMSPDGTAVVAGGADKSATLFNVDRKGMREIQKSEALRTSASPAVARRTNTKPT